jgi:hypothetical protein
VARGSDFYAHRKTTRVRVARDRRAFEERLGATSPATTSPVNEIGDREAEPRGDGE